MWLRAVVLAGSRGPWPPLLLASLAGWGLLIAFGHPPVMVGLCSGRLFDLGGGLSGASLALQVNGLAALAGCWALMLLAMTPPLLAQPLRRVWRGSLARRRGSVIAAFLLAYASVWMAAGAVLMAAAGVLGAAGAAGFAVALGLVLAWSLLPLRRACLARAHSAPRLRIFGLAAHVDGLAYGARSGLWCAGACWPLMLAPLLTGEWRLPAMAVAAVVMAAQRLSPVSTLRWDPPLRPAGAWRPA